MRKNKTLTAGPLSSSSTCWFSYFKDYYLALVSSVAAKAVSQLWISLKKSSLCLKGVEHPLVDRRLNYIFLISKPNELNLKIYIYMYLYTHLIQYTIVQIQIYFTATTKISHSIGIKSTQNVSKIRTTL